MSGASGLPCRARIIDATALPAYDLGSDHPFARDRQRPLFDLLHRAALVREADWLPATPATDAELQLAHDPDYLEVVRELSAANPDAAQVQRGWRHGLGNGDNPIAPGQYAAAAAIAGATLACVRAVMAGVCDHAFHPAGGLHHAMRRMASGFCLINDLVVGIREARRLGAGRVLYVDFDVHHGDGVEAAFQDDPDVITVSFHESPEVRFPGTGYVHDRGRGAALGTKINVPLASGTGDESWLACVRAVLPAAVARFRPALLVSQHGCDPHRSDPLADLQLTTQAMAEAAALTHALAHEHCGGRWVATGGGGYRPYHVIPRVWGMVWAILSGQQLPRDLDPGWIAAWEPRAGEPLPRTWHDAPCANPRAATAARINAQTLDDLVRLQA